MTLDVKTKAKGTGDRIAARVGWKSDNRKNLDSSFNRTADEGGVDEDIDTGAHNVVKKGSRRRNILSDSRIKKRTRSTRGRVVGKTGKLLGTTGRRTTIGRLEVLA